MFLCSSPVHELAMCVIKSAHSGWARSHEHMSINSPCKNNQLTRVWSRAGAPKQMDGMKGTVQHRGIYPFQEARPIFFTQSMNPVFSKWKLCSHHTSVLGPEMFTTLSWKLQFGRNERSSLLWAHLSPTSPSLQRTKPGEHDMYIWETQICAFSIKGGL